LEFFSLPSPIGLFLQNRPVHAEKHKRRLQSPRLPVFQILWKNTVLRLIALSGYSRLVRDVFLHKTGQF
jgi:hypothetical protein